MKERWSLVIHAFLVLGGLCAYLKEPDDVVWHFVQGRSNVRVLEHICFAIAAATLAISLWLRIQLDSGLAEFKNQQSKAGRRRMAAEFLQAVGIGSLMPLAGFILLVLGGTAFSVLHYKFGKQAGSELAATGGATSRSRPGIEAAPRSVMAKRGERRELLSRHAGLFCAVLSMVAFSITLSDRLADYLFAGTALITMLASWRTQRTYH